ncbi:MAG: hypothetical protein JW717_10255 [Marinilabiliaceae bacterium]|nr:hypothetical protein [Marinilabiliaceae bacterium]
MKYIIIIVVFFVNTFLFFGQKKVGSWTEHFPLNQGKVVLYGDGKVFLVAPTGVFFIDEETNSINLISAIHDIHNVGITSAVYSDIFNSLILGFEDGLLVIYKDDKAYAISDIKDKLMSGNKAINNMFLDNNYLYLATGFGIVKVNLSKNEILETYPVSSTSESVSFNNILKNDNKLWALSNNGLYCADLDQPNLINYQSWEKVMTATAGEKFLNAVQYGDSIIIGALYNTNSNRLIIYNSDSIFRYDLGSNNLKKVCLNNNYLYLIKPWGIDILDMSYQFIESISKYDTNDKYISVISPNDVLIHEGTTYIADDDYGLVQFSKNAKETRSIFPSRPESNLFRDFDVSNHEVIIATGNFLDIDVDPIYHYYKDGEWSSFSEEKEGVDNVGICNSIKFLPGVDSVFYLASWGYGLYKYSNNKIVKWYNPETTNNAIKKPFDWRRSVWISGLEFDKKGNLWMLNSNTSTPLLCKNEEDKWRTYDYPGLVYSSPIGEKLYLYDMLIDSRGFKWIILRRNGLFVVDDNGTLDDVTDDVYRGRRTVTQDTDPRNVGPLEIKNSSGEIFDYNINTITEDKDGLIWIGNDEGVLVLDRAWAVFQDSEPSFRKILIPRNDGTDDADILLDNIKVTAIAVDGANRKWIGTESSGVYLVSEDGTKTILEFNTENSVLLSNSISGIGIDHESGEVYIGTGNGIVSYRGSATKPLTNFSNVYAYPNPVPSNYNGKIIIKGLIQDSNVKIADISGNIVFETESLGGQAVWNGRNIMGERVSTGVYLIMVASSDGMVSEVGKIIVIKGK